MNATRRAVNATRRAVSARAALAPCEEDGRVGRRPPPGACAGARGGGWRLELRVRGQSQGVGQGSGPPRGDLRQASSCPHHLGELGPEGHPPDVQAVEAPAFGLGLGLGLGSGSGSGSEGHAPDAQRTSVASSSSLLDAGESSKASDCLRDDGRSEPVPGLGAPASLGSALGLRICDGGDGCTMFKEAPGCAPAATSAWIHLMRSEWVSAASTSRGGF